jgi:hypothetical protein
MDAFLGFRYHMINMCFIHCNSALQKLFSMAGMLCQMHEGKIHTMSFVITCEVLWHPMCTHFSVMQLVVNNDLQTTQQDV